MRNISSFVAIGFFILFESANAETNPTPQIIASCGASAGHAYFHHNDLVLKKDSGWSKDWIKDGSLMVQKIGEEYDLVYRDRLGLQSSVDNGAVIFPTHLGKTSLSLVVVYPENGNSETYNFQHLETNEAEVSWTSTKVGTVIAKSGVFYAKCQNNTN